LSFDFDDDDDDDDEDDNEDEYADDDDNDLSFSLSLSLSQNGIYLNNFEVQQEKTKEPRRRTERPQLCSKYQSPCVSLCARMCVCVCGWCL
jgi:hypothetical protein